MGRCGPVGLFVMYKSTTASRVEGSHPGRSSFFCVNVPAANCSEENCGSKLSREKKGGSGDRRTKDRQAYQEWIRVRHSVRLSKLIKW